MYVNRTLKLLVAEGLIERDKRSASFPNWQKMRDAADFNERYLHPGIQAPIANF